MPTNSVGSRAQRGIRLSPNEVDVTVSFDTTDIANGVTIARLPADAMIDGVGTTVNVITAFNAGTTNVLVVGWGASLNELVAAGDVDESSATVQVAATGKGKITSGEVDVKAKYTYTGTAPTTGKARIRFTYSSGTRVL